MQGQIGIKWRQAYVFLKRLNVFGKKSRVKYRGEVQNFIILSEAVI
jgi:hypothetical protein